LVDPKHGERLQQAFFNGPASTASKPSLPTSSITFGFLPALPQQGRTCKDPWICPNVKRVSGKKKQWFVAFQCGLGTYLCRVR
jgi:hypothetical protein